MTQEAFDFIQKWNHLSEKEFTELFLSEVPKFGIGSLDTYRQSVNFEPPHQVDKVAMKLQLFV